MNLLINKTATRISILYLVISIVTISVRVLEYNQLENIFKPLLMPLLMLILFLNSEKFSLKSSKLLIFALFFSMLGDIFLMPFFDNFLVGLASFLIAHIFYIIGFYRINESLIGGLKKNKLYSVIILLAYVFLILLLINSMLANSVDTFMMVAVVIYATVITVMVLTTISLNSNLNSVGGKLIMLGAIIFMISDAIIALNKFTVEIKLSGLWIMMTYTFGQWLLTVGNIKRDIRLNN